MDGSPHIPRVALSRQEAAISLGMSIDSFERHVQPELRLIRRGKLRLVPVAELERWANESAESVLGRSHGARMRRANDRDTRSPRS
jgi:hypothetical protein